MTTTIAPGLSIPAYSATLRHRALAPLAVGLLGFAIAVIGIGIPSIWYDEAATITSTTRSWPQLWAELGNVDAVHGLYYFLIHAIFDVVGYSPLALRIPSAIAVGAAAAFTVVLGRQLSDRRLGLVAGLIFVVLPRVTWAGIEGRSYALTALLAAVLTVVFLRAQQGPRRRWWVLYSALVLLSCTLFIYLALVVLAHGVSMAWRLLRHDGLATYFARRWAVAAASAGALCVPLSLKIVAQGGQVAWIPPIGPDTAGQVLVNQWFDGALPLAIAAWALILIGVFWHVRRGNHGVLRTLVPALAVPTLALVAISVAHAPLYQPRYLTMGTPFAALAIAAGTTFLPWRHGLVVALAAIVGLALPAIIAQRTPEAKESASWSQVADFIAADRTADGPGVATAFIYGNVQRHPSATSRVMAYAYPAAFADSTDVTLITPAAQTAQLWETRAPIGQSTARLADSDVAYLITSSARDLRPETTAALAAAGWHVALTWSFTTGHVVKYERNTD